jgi:hypothetical protein
VRADGQGEQLALAQPAVGRGIDHQLIQVPAPPLGQGLAEPGDISAGGDLGDPALQLHHHTASAAGGRAGIPEPQDAGPWGAA